MTSWSSKYGFEQTKLDLLLYCCQRLAEALDDLLAINSTRPWGQSMPDLGHPVVAKLRCQHCGTTHDLRAADVTRYSQQNAWPTCCNELMRFIVYPIPSNSELVEPSWQQE